MTTTFTRTRADIPRISPLSWLGLESAAWAVVIGHLVKWAVDALYFLVIQVKYQVGYNGSTWTIWYLKDAWDRLPVHLENLLGAHWFDGQAAPGWWMTDRHYARDVLIGLVTGVIVTFLFTKPRYPEDTEVGPLTYAFAIPKALLYAIPGVALVGLLAWKVQYLDHHGLTIGGGSVLANEVNGFVAAGSWIPILMGVAGSQLFARFASKKPADAAQWFYAERSAAKIQSETGLGRLRGTRVIGTPTHRVRVRWLMEHRTRPFERSAWAVRILTGALAVTTILAGLGAWLTLAGPAAGAH